MTTTQAAFDTLPNEVLYTILQKLDDIDTMQVCLAVSHKWNTLLQLDGYMPFLKRAFIMSFHTDPTRWMKRFDACDLHRRAPRLVALLRSLTHADIVSLNALVQTPLMRYRYPSLLPCFVYMLALGEHWKVMTYIAKTRSIFKNILHQLPLSLRSMRFLDSIRGLISANVSTMTADKQKHQIMMSVDKEKAAFLKSWSSSSIAT